MEKKENKFINVDANNAVASIANALSEVVALYPITPSTPMGEGLEDLVNNGEKNIFGESVIIQEMQSEGGASGAVHGSLACGALTTTFTASQGLLLMIPNMFKIAGELLPTVFHVSARTVATHALSIFGDHSDVMACRSTGFNMLCSGSVQEAQDFALASHLIALETSLPVLHFFDGFRTSHEVQKIKSISMEDIKKIVPYEKIAEFKQRALSPNHPHQRGTAQNPDIFFQNREACNLEYEKVYDATVKAFKNIQSITGRQYAPFEYFGSNNAENVIVMMGSGAETAQETIEYLNKINNNYGLVKVRLFLPFNTKAFISTLPENVKNIAVLDRTKESGAVGEPLMQAVVSALYKEKKHINIIGGRYGLGGKEFTPACVKAVLDNLTKVHPINPFTVGIIDDLTNTSLEEDETFEIDNGATEFKFYGLGSDGTVSANKNTIKIIGENTSLYTQGYFEYDSKKSGSLTISHLRTNSRPIKSTYTATHANFIAIHNFSFIGRYEMLKGLKKGGIVLINTVLDVEELQQKLPEDFKQQLKQANAKLFCINAQRIANELGLRNKINIIMQTAFFKISQVIDYNIAKSAMEIAVKKTYGKKGDAVVNMNINAIKTAENQIFEVNVDDLFKDKCPQKIQKTDNEYYENFIRPIDRLKGNDLPVSAFAKDGCVPTDTAKYQKRGIAEQCPQWMSENCIQCGLCVSACPHACLRPVLVSDDTKSELPKSFVTKTALGTKNLNYRLQLSPLDCTGCGVCAKVCPAKNKALKMEIATDIIDKEQNNFQIMQTTKQEPSPFPINLTKGLQFKKPYFEYNYACAGCGETPYIKMATQLFGDSMIIANATGCSSIYGGSAPACPYAKDENGFGPAWANSLFEDNAEYGMGMALAVQAEVKRLRNLCLNFECSGRLKELLNDFKDKFLSLHEQKEVIDLLQMIMSKEAQKILSLKDYFLKKSIWIIGGDGWAYDIGYGGLDHTLASDVNVNILVLDSEVYSNTGGQASKATPKGAVAKFAGKGKAVSKKDISALAILHKNAYVAQISLGANPNQAIKSFIEAENHNGPSIIVAYAPCINHGFNMTNSNEEMKKAVDCGYWTLFRYNPNAEEKLVIDSPEPTGNYEEFLMGESRYSALMKKDPERAKVLFALSEKDSKERRKTLIALKQLNN